MYKKDYKSMPKTDFLFDLDITETVSTNDFTGAIPTPPQSEAEKENYMNLMDYSPETIDVFQQKEDK